MHSFFAMMARMKYIERWALMHNVDKENISEHSLEVAMLAHGLAIIAKEKCNQDLDPNEVALMGIYHDANEIITGDMPTPVKYYDTDIQEAYRRVENVASHTLINKLPDYMKQYYKPLFFQRDGKAYEWRLVKAADKLSALIKCREELRSGNQEFKTAESSIKKYLQQMDMQEIDIFIQEFLPAYELTLDELQKA